MDPAQIAILSNALAPILATLVVCATPVAILFTVKHFKLRQREMELEAQLHSREWQARLQSVEARLGALEAALGGLGSGRGPAQERAALLEPPPVPAQKVRG